MRVETSVTVPAELIVRLDSLIQEMQDLRRQISFLATVKSESNFVQRLYGAMGQGTREEYDVFADYERFAE